MGLIAAFKRRMFKEKIKVALFQIDRYVMQTEGWSWATTLSLEQLRDMPSARLDEAANKLPPVDCAVIMWATAFQIFSARLKDEGSPFSKDAFFLICARLQSFIKDRGVTDGTRIAVMQTMEQAVDST